MNPETPQLPAHHVSPGLKLVLFLLAILLVGGLGYFTWMVNGETAKTEEIAPSVKDKTEETATTTTTTKDETADWKTYVSAAYKFSLKHPPTYSVAESAGTISFRATATTGVEGDYPELNVSAKTTTMTLDQFAADKKTSGEIDDQSKTNLGGMAAYEGVSRGLLAAYTIFSVTGGYSYELVLDTDSKETLALNKAQLSSDQKLILNSFKFTK